MTPDSNDVPGLDFDALADPDERPTATQLARLSDLDRGEVLALEDVWPEMELSRRHSIIVELADLAQDNVDFNFDNVYKMALSDEEGAVRGAALVGLVEYEGRDLIPVLAAMLREDPEPDVRREAAVALGRYAVEAELGNLRDSDFDQIREILMESTEDVDEHEGVRARAIEALGAISGEEIDNLIESIYFEDSMLLKVGAVDAMGRSANEDWLPTVLKELVNRAPEMRHAAAFALGEMGSDDGIEPLELSAIQDPDKEVRLAAVHSLGEIGGPRARVALQHVLFEGRDDLRPAVEEAMAEIDFAENPLTPDF